MLGTSHGPGTTSRSTATLMITAAQALALATPDALPRCWASKVRDARPSSVNPTTAGANATIGQASAFVRSEPGPEDEHACHRHGGRHQQRRAQPCHDHRGRACFGKHTADVVAALLGGGGQPREAQLQQRCRKHRVREQVDGVRPGESGQGTLITGLLSRPVDQQAH